MTTREQLDSALKTWGQFRTAIDKRIVEYKAMNQPDGHQLSDMKLHFITAQDMVGSFVGLAKDLSLKTALIAKNKEYEERLKLRKDGETIENAKTKAWLLCATEHMEALEADVLLDKAWHIKNVAKDYKEEINQRIAIVRDESFNSRQPEII